MFSYHPPRISEFRAIFPVRNFWCGLERSHRQKKQSFFFTYCLVLLVLLAVWRTARRYDAHDKIIYLNRREQLIASEKYLVGSAYDTKQNKMNVRNKVKKGRSRTCRDLDSGRQTRSLRLNILSIIYSSRSRLCLRSNGYHTGCLYSIFRDRIRGSWDSDAFGLCS